MTVTKMAVTKMAVSKMFVILLLCGDVIEAENNIKIQTFPNSVGNFLTSSLDISKNCSLEHNKTTTNPATGLCGPSPKHCSSSRYRSLDGSCNNLQRPSWGAANTPYVRLTRANYADGISAFAKSVTGNPLPNPRELSFKLFLTILSLDPKFNLNAAQYGQIITHDMSRNALIIQTNAGADVRCCNDNVIKKPYGCAQILVPKNDPTYLNGRRCILFSRTKNTKDVGCTAPNVTAEPLTLVTGFMDLSLVYGNSDCELAALRTGHRGKMSTVTREGQEWPQQSPNPSNFCPEFPNKPCYLAGDDRVNQNPQLTVLLVILLREHNRVADILANLNPHWDDERVFQEARRILIAVIQHINYYEYLPIFLGGLKNFKSLVSVYFNSTVGSPPPVTCDKNAYGETWPSSIPLPDKVVTGYKHMEINKLIYSNSTAYVNDYNPNVNPSIINEHATAAFRHFHNLFRGYLNLLSENRLLVEIVRLSDWYNTAALLETNDGFNKLTRGLTAQKMSLSDSFWTAEVTNYLFKGNKTYGDELRAIDIQRSRDHGLSSYSSARAACKLTVPKTFEDMMKYIPKQDVWKLQHLYAAPEDVDLVVGGSLEYNVRGSMVGPTFLCILTKQFYNTRVGDRYFYENGVDPEIAFTHDQLNTIRKDANMARILCDNAHGVLNMQPQAFLLFSEHN